MKMLLLILITGISYADVSIQVFDLNTSLEYNITESFASPVDNNTTKSPEDYDFSITYQAESSSGTVKYDAVNMDDVGKGMSLGFIQFNGVYARRLSKALGIKSWMSKKQIQKRLRTQKSKDLQDKMFREIFVAPVLSFAKENNITDKKVIEFIVDWKVNGLPRSYYKKITSNSTIKQLIKLRNRRYIRIYNNNRKKYPAKHPKRYTESVLKRWLERTKMFT